MTKALLKAESTDISPLSEQMLREFGPMLSGKKLCLALGFNSFEAFNRAIRLQQINLNIFRIAGRRGKFALTTDVATWIERQARPSLITTSNQESLHEGVIAVNSDK